LPILDVLMRTVGAILLAVSLTLFFSEPAFAVKRVALVMGNSSYQHVSRLPNPVNDSEAMASTLTNAGFDVVSLKRDLKASELRRALRDFSDHARDADMAIIYFAGHGIEIDGINYVIPVDAVLERDIDAYDEAISLDRLLSVIEPAKQLRLVILDACRDNPFARTMKRTIASRAVGRGLAKVEPVTPNTLVAFAARAGSTASDGDSKNSPFTAALVKYLPRPGLDLRKAFGFVRDDVLKITNNRQEPFIYGSLGGEDLALVPVVTTQTAGDPNAAVRRDYELALQVATKEVWDSFISTYPSGFYTDLAKAQRDRLIAEAARVAAAEKAKAAEDERKRLAEEGAKAAEQAKAAAEAKAAEQARIAAEKKKALEDLRLAEAERAKAAALAKAEEDSRIAAEKAAKAKAAAEAKAAEAERIKPVAEPEADRKTDEKQVGQLAALAPDQNQPAAEDLPRLLQGELRRVGCSTGAIDGNWNAAWQKSLGLFNKNARTQFDVKVASIDALNAVRSKPARICPLICERGYKAEGDNCIKIVCKPGFEIGDDNTCQRIVVKKPEKPVANVSPSTAPDANAPRNVTSTPSARHKEYEPMGSGKVSDGNCTCKSICNKFAAAGQLSGAKIAQCKSDCEQKFPGCNKGALR
jgi:uncharacterized caspase-like protein